MSKKEPNLTEKIYEGFIENLLMSNSATFTLFPRRLTLLDDEMVPNDGQFPIRLEIMILKCCFVKKIISIQSHFIVQRAVKAWILANYKQLTIIDFET